MALKLVIGFGAEREAGKVLLGFVYIILKSEKFFEFLLGKSI